MNEKFTEGEWEVANGLLVGEQVLFIHAFGKQVICRLTKQVDTTPLTEEDVANAHLMASSKKMYKMLEMLSYSVDNKVYKQEIEKLLKEARGDRS